MTLQESWGILKWGFWQIATRSILQMIFGIKLNDVHSSPKERQLQKTCVSFGEECTLIPNCMGSYHGQILIETETDSYNHCHIQEDREDYWSHMNYIRFPLVRSSICYMPDNTLKWESFTFLSFLSRFLFWESSHNFPSIYYKAV